MARSQPRGAGGFKMGALGGLQADIEMAFCFTNYKRMGETQNIYAKTRAEAMAKSHPNQMWCHDGPCTETTAPPEQCAD